MSQEIDGEKIIEEIFAKQNGRDSVKKLFLMGEEDSKKFAEAKLQHFNEISEQYKTQELNAKDLMEHTRSIWIDHSYMGKIRNASYKLMKELSELFESIKKLNSDIGDSIAIVTNHWEIMQTKAADLQETLIEIEKEGAEEQAEIEGQSQQVKEKLSAIRVKTSLKEESLIATEQTAAKKKAKLDDIQKESTELQEELNQLHADDIEQYLTELIAHNSALEADLTTLNVNIQNALEELQSAETLGNENAGNIDKIKVLIKKDEENIAKMRAALAEKQAAFMTLLKIKIDIEAQKVYDHNVGVTQLLSDELHEKANINAKKEDVNQRSVAEKEKIGENEAKLNERNMNISNIEEDIKKARETADKSATVTAEEIKTLNEQVKEADAVIEQLQTVVNNLKDEIKDSGGIPFADLVSISTNANAENESSVTNCTSSDSNMSADICSIISSLSGDEEKSKPKVSKGRSKSSSNASDQSSGYRVSKKKRRTK